MRKAQALRLSGFFRLLTAARAGIVILTGLCCATLPTAAGALVITIESALRLVEADASVQDLFDDQEAHSSALGPLTLGVNASVGSSTNAHGEVRLSDISLVGDVLTVDAFGSAHAAAPTVSPGGGAAHGKSELDLVFSTDETAAFSLDAVLGQGLAFIPSWGNDVTGFRHAVLTNADTNAVIAAATTTPGTTSGVLQAGRYRLHLLVDLVYFTGITIAPLNSGSYDAHLTVRPIVAVPTPGTAALFAAGLIALAIARPKHARKRR